MHISFYSTTLVDLILKTLGTPAMRPRFGHDDGHVPPVTPTVTSQVLAFRASPSDEDITMSVLNVPHPATKSVQKLVCCFRSSCKRLNISIYRTMMSSVMLCTENH